MAPRSRRRGGRPRLQGRGLPLAAQVHRWAGDAGRPRRAPRPLPNSVPTRARRRHGGVRQPASSTCTCATRAPRGRRHARRSSIRSARASSSRLKEAVGAEAIREREESFIASRAATGGRPTRTSRSSAATTRRGCRSCRSSSGTSDAVSAPQLRRGAAQRPVRDPGARADARAPARTATACSASTSRTSHAFREQIAPRVRGHQARLGAGQLQLLHHRGGVRFILDAVDLVATEGWRLLPWYRFDAATGLWRHAAGLAEPPMSLDAVSFDPKGSTPPPIGITNRSCAATAIWPRPAPCSPTCPPRRRRKQRRPYGGRPSSVSVGSGCRGSWRPTAEVVQSDTPCCR